MRGGIVLDLAPQDIGIGEQTGKAFDMIGIAIASSIEQGLKLRKRRSASNGQSWSCHKEGIAGRPVQFCVSAGLQGQLEVRFQH
jgi:hypothetical protein